MSIERPEKRDQTDLHRTKDHRGCNSDWDVSREVCIAGSKRKKVDDH
jgi:hypothetical protein